MDDDDDILIVVADDLTTVVVEDLVVTAATVEVDETLYFVTSEGPPGRDGTSLGSVVGSGVVDEPIHVGQAVAVNRANSRYVLARADVYARRDVIGLAADSADTGTVLVIEGGTLNLADWSLVTGVPSLTSGAVYFLSTVAGQITAVPPSDVGNSVVRVGVASGPKNLVISPGTPVLL